MIRLQTLATTVTPTRDTTPALMPQMTKTFTLGVTSPILIFFSGTFSNSNNDRGGTFSCMIDDQSDAEMQRNVLFSGANDPYVVSMQKMVYLTPGTHTVEIWWAASANTLSNTGIQRSLTILEVSLT